MSNPILAWLRGDDLKRQDTKALVMPERAIQLLQPIEYVPPLMHGPGVPAWGDQRGHDFNSAVFACLVAYADAYVEAPPRVFRVQERGKATWLEAHPWQALLDRPNAFMSGLDLLWWTEYCRRLDGNAYWRKLRSGNATTGNVVELWPLSPHLVTPVRFKGSDKFIDAYRFDYAPGKFEEYAVEDIVHFKLGIDDHDHRYGISPIKRLVREVAGDQEAARWAQQLLANGGSMGMMVTPPEGSNLTLDQARALEDHLVTKFTGEGRGRISVLAPGAKAEPYGFSPEQMDLRSLHYIPETRIAAVMRVPAVVAGLAAGIEKSGQFSNFREAREQFIESTVLPAYQFDAAKINHGLRDDFARSDRRVLVRFDITDMRVLQEDEDKKYARLNIGVQGKWITRNEARTDVGLPPIEGGDVIDAPAEQQDVPNAPGQAKLLRLAAQQKAVGKDDLAEALLALVDLGAPALEKDMARHLDDQRRRIGRQIMRGA